MSKRNCMVMMCMVMLCVVSVSYGWNDEEGRRLGNQTVAILTYDSVADETAVELLDFGSGAIWGHQTVSGLLYGVDMAILDGDNLFDIALGQGDHVLLLEEQSNGSMVSSSICSRTDGRFVRAVAFTDWDDDGDLDLMIGANGAYSPTNTLAPLLERWEYNGSSWVLAETITTNLAYSRHIVGLAGGDFDKDGEDDLLVLVMTTAYCGHYAFHWDKDSHDYAGATNTVFTFVDYNAAFATYGIDYMDIDSDGQTEIFWGWNIVSGWRYCAISEMRAEDDYAQVSWWGGRDTHHAIYDESETLLYTGICMGIKNAPSVCADDYAVKYGADINKDCYVNMLDLAEMGADWLECTDPANPACGYSYIY